MGFLFQSMRRRISMAAIMMATLLASVPVSSLAQQDSQGGTGESQNGSGAASGAAQATEPVLVVTLGSVNKLLQDLDYVTAAVGRPDAGGMVKMMAGMFTQGIDPTQPIGLIVPLVNGSPEPIVMLPTADVKSVLKRLEAQTGPVDELDDGTLAVIVNGTGIFIRQVGNWAVLARNRDALALAPADPSTLFAGMGNQYDLAVRLQMQQVPAGVRNLLISQIRQGFEQAMAQQNNGDAAEGRKVAENTIQQLEQFIQETDELKFGINIDQAAKLIAMDFSFTAVPGSELAAMYAGQKAIPSRFASVIRPDAAGFYHAAASVSPELAKQSKASIDNSLAMIRSALANESDLTPEQQADINALVDRIANLIVDTFSEGKVDMGALLLNQQNNLQFVAGAFVADGNEVAQILRDVAEKAKGETDAPRFTFDRGTYKDVTMHLVEVDIPADQEQARQIFGETLQVHIGTAPKAVYFALGSSSMPLLKQLIDSGASDAGASRPLAQMQTRMLPILQYVQSVQNNDTVAAMIDALARAPDPGEITIVGESIPNGQKTRMTVAEGVLQAIGAAVRQSQQAQLQDQGQGQGQGQGQF